MLEFRGEKSLSGHLRCLEVKFADLTMAEVAQKIRAAVVKEANGPFIFEDVQLDEPRNGEVHLVSAASAREPPLSFVAYGLCS